MKRAAKSGGNLPAATSSLPQSSAYSVEEGGKKGHETLEDFIGKKWEKIYECNKEMRGMQEMFSLQWKHEVVRVIRYQENKTGVKNHVFFDGLR